jgi:PAS domain S-box-containing protein
MGVKRSRADGVANTAHLRLMVGSVRDYAIFMLDPAGIIITWNRGAERLKGYTADEIIGQSHACFYTPEDLADGRPARLLKIARTEGRVEDEAWRVRKDGTRFWADVVITALRDESGTLVGYGKVTRDLTERRAAELAQAESEQRFRLLVSNVKDYAIFMLDRDGIVTTWNEGAQRLKGYAASEIEGRSFENFYTAEDKARGWPKRELEIARRDGRVEDIGWRIRKDGTRFWADVVITALRDESGRLIGYAKVTRDLTERRRADEQRDQLVRDLATSNRELESFGYSVSHDLRAPLRAIDGFSLALLEDYGDKLDEAGRQYLERVRAASQRMGHLIDHMLRLSRVTRGTMARDHVDLSDLAAQVALQLQAGDPKHVVEWDIQPDLVASGDQQLLRQVFENLLGNAFKFTRKTADPRIEIGAEPDTTPPVFFVRDNGAGFDMRFADQLFGPFQRLHGDHEFEGTGIGLATVQRIVHRHGGWIRGQGEPGHGATFRFTLESGLG